MNLLALNAEGYRSNGSVGFAINGFDTIVTCESWHENCVEIVNSVGDLSKVEYLILFLDDVFKAINASVHVRVVIEQQPIAHSGFGSGTALRLSLVDAVLLVNDMQLDRNKTVKLSRRGGTSGVGVNTYFDGGFIAESGVPNKGLKSTSSADKEGVDFRQPTVIVQKKMPPWFIGIFLVGGITGVAGESERQFFDENTPILQSSVEASIYHAIMGTASAVIDNDYQRFAESVRNVQTLEWKAAEWKIQDPRVHEARDLLYESGATSVGLSSFGPALYYTGQQLDFSSLNRLGRSVVSSPNNRGRIISRV